MRRTHYLVLTLIIALPTAFAFQVTKKSLTHDVYDSWKALAGTAISRNGANFAYTINPQVGDGNLYVGDSDSKTSKPFPRGTAVRFTADSKFALFTTVPTKVDVDKAKKEKKAPKDQPKNSLSILNLAAGTLVTIERVKSWRLPVKDSGWFAYQLDEAPSPPAPTPAKPETKPPSESEDQGTTQEPKKEEPKKEEPKKDEPKKKKEHTVGSEWILRKIDDGTEVKLADVGDIIFSDSGNAALYTISDKTGERDGLYWHDLGSNKTTTIATGKGQYKNAVIHKGTGRIAFLTDRDRYEKDPSEFNLHIWNTGDSKSREVVVNGNPGISKDFVVLSRGSLRFSFSGNRVFFATGPKPLPEPKPADPDEEKAVVDVWSHTDKVLMPQQLLQVTTEKNRTYEAMLDISKTQVLQVETPAMNSVTIGNRGDGRYGIANDDDLYRAAASWTETPNDVYVFDTQTGSTSLLRKAFYDNGSLNPAGAHYVYFDGEAKHYMSVELSSGKTVNISAGITVPLWDTTDDHPVRAFQAGLVQYLDNGDLVITDSRDLWVLSIDGSKRPICFTDGLGRFQNMTFSIQAFPREDDVVGLNAKQPVMLRVLNQDTMANGFFIDQFYGKDSPKSLVMGKFSLAMSGKSAESNTMLVRKGSFTEYPELYVTDTSFANMAKVSDTNPQQRDYNWGKSEIVNWLSADGVPLKGVLIKPEDFDPGKKYPMIVYFYEVSSTDLHQHRVPSPSASTINPTMFASNGYLVFMPDIPYTIGYPGESAEKAIISGTLEVVRRGYVDPKRIGIQGQSWGGYQVMHLITRTKLYAAAGAGAAVSNMTSAYGGIRLGSGLVRQFQYEVGQTRIGGSIWDYPLRYLENSPLFYADKVQTPVLMMNNDADDAVPFQQGVEMFTALRRLGKTAWMLNYNGDKHNLSKRPNQKDLSMRLHQFFDYYLKDGPLPKWMAEGVPAIQKGQNYGLEPVKKGGG